MNGKEILNSVIIITIIIISLGWDVTKIFFETKIKRDDVNEWCERCKMINQVWIERALSLAPPPLPPFWHESSVTDWTQQVSTNPPTCANVYSWRVWKSIMARSAHQLGRLGCQPNHSQPLITALSVYITFLR